MLPAPNNSKTLASFSIVSVCVYGALIACAFFIWLNLDVPVVIRGDAQGYLNYAQGLIAGQFDRLLSDFHPYGYALFLAIFIQAASFLGMSSFYPLVFAVQFGLHIITAVLATRITQRSLTQNRPWVLYLVFAVVACNPYLLAMITQILTENLSVFFITLSFYCLQSEALHSTLSRRAAIGITLGFASLTRPFNLVWAVGVIGFLGIAALWDMYSRKNWSFTAPAIRLGQILVCFVFIVSTQQLAGTFYKYTQNAGTPTTEDVSANPSLGVMTLHLKAAAYTYRYETLYRQDRNVVAGVYYSNQRLNGYARQPEVLLMPFIKLTSLFQQHDYKVYRPVFGIVSPTAFAVGLILWIMFCYTVAQALYDIWQAWRLGSSIPTAGLLTVMLILFVALYAVFTVPEPRYILSIYPLLTSLFAFYAVRAKRWWPFMTLLTVGIIAYGLTAHTLLWALQIAGNT